MKLSATVARIQAFVEPLCLLNDGEFNADELARKAATVSQFLDETKGQVISEFCTKYPHSRAEYKAWLDCAMDHGFTPTPTQLLMARGRYKISNWVGMVFSYGTACPCCLGIRTAAMTVVAIAGWAAFFIK